MKICIDGNDGTGKTTLIAKLREVMPEHEYQDRGLPTDIVMGFTPKTQACLYIVLSCDPLLSYKRLLKSGKDMTEHWHKLEILQKYDLKYLEMSEIHKDWHLVNSDMPEEALLETVIKIINNWAL